MCLTHQEERAAKLQKLRELEKENEELREQLTQLAENNPEIVQAMSECYSLSSFMIYYITWPWFSRDRHVFWFMIYLLQNGMLRLLERQQTGGQVGCCWHFIVNHPSCLLSLPSHSRFSFLVPLVMCSFIHSPSRQHFHAENTLHGQIWYWVQCLRSKFRIARRFWLYLKTYWISFNIYLTVNRMYRLDFGQ